MKKLLIMAFVLLSTITFAQQTKLAEEKIPYLEYTFKCHFCGNTYTFKALDWRNIKNADIDKCFGVFAQTKEMSAASQAQEDAEREECNGSKNGKHTWHLDSKKELMKVKVRMDSNGSCNVVD